MSINTKAFSAAVDATAGDFPPESGITYDVLQRLCVAYYEAAKASEQPVEKTILSGQMFANWKQMANGAAEALADKELIHEARALPESSQPDGWFQEQVKLAKAEVEKRPQWYKDAMRPDCSYCQNKRQMQIDDGPAYPCPKCGEPDDYMTPAILSNYRNLITESKDANGQYHFFAAMAETLIDYIEASRTTKRESVDVDLGLIDDAITKLTKAAANLVNGEGFTSSFAEDHRATTPKWAIDCFVRDDAKRTYLGNEIAQGINWIRNATAKLRENRRRG